MKKYIINYNEKDINIYDYNNCIIYIYFKVYFSYLKIYMEDDEIEFKEMKWDNVDSIEQSIFILFF